MSHCTSAEEESRLKAGGWSFYIFMRFSTDSRTICGAGAFACQLVMFYRRKLPPWHPDLTEATFLFVTWRLAGSIPRARPLAGAHRRKSIRGPSLPRLGP